MRIFSSCLSTQETVYLLKAHWSIDTEQLEPLGAATAYCTKVHVRDNCYFLKEFQDSFTHTRAETEFHVCSRLIACGIPASVILPAASGAPYVLCGNRVFQLQRFFDGTTPPQNSLREAALCQASSLLGKIHRVLCGHALPTLFDEEWLQKFDKSSYMAFYEETLDLVRAAETDSTRRQKMEADILFRMELTAQMERLAAYFQHITYTPSHGDYTPGQLLCDGDRIVRVVDFANAHTVPASLELIRFYALASADCKAPCRFDLPSFKRYLNAYLKEFPLSQADLTSLPYVYAYYMGRNRFVYRDFLMTGDPVSFDISAQRAAVTRYFFENAEAIAAALAALT